MRAILGIVGLVIVLAVVGLRAKKQMLSSGGSDMAGSTSGQANSRQMPRQIKSTVEGLMQPRTVPDDK